MTYVRFEPGPELAPFVDSISFQHDPRPAPAGGWSPTRVIPTGRVDLIVNLGDPFIHENNGAGEPAPKNSLVGHWTRPVEVRATGRTEMIIVSFHPWGASSFCPIPLHEINDCSIDLSDFWARSLVSKLREQLLEASSPEARLELVQQALIGKLTGARDPLVVWAAQEINRSFGDVDIDGLARQAGVSRRTLLRRFKGATGLNPKLFSGIVRFQKALFLLRAGKSWIDVASLCNYYDQPHLIREIRRFSGYSPGTITPRFQSLPLHSYFNAGRSLSHFYNTVYL